MFLCYGARLNKWVLQTYHPEYMKSPLVYHPGHRARAWRFLTYMFMHVGLEQLGFNALLQLMIGVPLEMVHGVLRISLLYLAGVLAGSLTVSITDMRAPLVGGSGGVYALCSAHLANVVMVTGLPLWGGGKGPAGCASQPVCLPPPELGWDAVSVQAAEDGAGSGVHEFRSGPGCVAALLPTTARLRPTAQLHGTPGWCSGRCKHGPYHPSKL